MDLASGEKFMKLLKGQGDLHYACIYAYGDHFM